MCCKGYVVTEPLPTNVLYSSSISPIVVEGFLLYRNGSYSVFVRVQLICSDVLAFRQHVTISLPFGSFSHRRCIYSSVQLENHTWKAVHIKEFLIMQCCSSFVERKEHFSAVIIYN
jgi:hypothetical protein